MKQTYSYPYPRPMVTVDLVVFAFDGMTLRSLFIRRKGEPYAGKWAIPGGYLEMDERIEAAALRELMEETGLAPPEKIEVIGVYGDPGRDPRGRTISVAHTGLVKGTPAIKGGDDAKEAAWLDPRGMKDLAFDHEKIIQNALGWLRATISKDDGPFLLLPDLFTRDQVSHLFGSVFEEPQLGSRWLTRQVRAGSATSPPGKVRTYRRVV